MNAERPFELRSSQSREPRGAEPIAVARKTSVRRGVIATAALLLLIGVFLIRFAASATKLAEPAHNQLGAPRVNPATTPLLPPPSAVAQQPAYEEKPTEKPQIVTAVAPSKKVAKRAAPKAHSPKPLVEPDPDPGF